MPLPSVDQRRLFLGADRLCLPAAGPEPAARRWVRGVRDIALEHDALAPAPVRRILDRDRRQQRLRVRVRRALEDVVPRPDLNDLAEVHHRHAIGDVADE